MDRINQILTVYKYPLLLCLVGIVLVYCGGVIQNSTASSTKPKELPTESIVKAESLELKADIGGAVIKPGVYNLKKDSRVQDLIIAAGGLESSASAEYIAKQLNLSQKVSDGQKVYIPFKGEEKSATVLSVTNSVARSSSPSQPTAKISINNASQSELESLPGIGPVTASKIISNRPYADPNELISKKAVGKATYEKIKDQIDL